MKIEIKTTQELQAKRYLYFPDEDNNTSEPSLLFQLDCALGVKELYPYEIHKNWISAESLNELLTEIRTEFVKMYADFANEPIYIKLREVQRKLENQKERGG
jgi:hypothetical protein